MLIFSKEECYMSIYKKNNKANIVCNCCGHDESYVYFIIDDETKCVTKEWGECVSCGTTTFRKSYNLTSNTATTSNQAQTKSSQQISPPQVSFKPTVRCPYCNSTNTKKISTLSRMGSFATFGFAGKKVGKQWHCNNCKSDF